MLLTFSAEAFEWPSADFHFPTALSLGIIFTILAVTIIASLMAEKRDPGGGGHGGPGGSIGESLPGPAGEGREKWADDSTQAGPVT